MDVRKIWSNLDYLTLGVYAVLATVGVFLVASASQPFAPTSDPLYFAKRQIIWLVLGAVMAFVVAAIPYERFQKYSVYIYWGTVLVLTYVVVKGHVALGASRWINIGPFQLQPSEFAKIAIVITLATHLNKRPQIKSWRSLISPLLHVGLPMLLILKQPDLGTTLVFVAITMGMLYMAGMPTWKWLIIFPGGFAAIVFWVYAHFQWHIPIPMHKYQLDRLLVFLNPQKYAMGSGFNIIQSRIAVGTGGLLGTGLLKAHASQLSFLPEAYTDFIFAVIGKELGFIGAVAILLVYLLLLARGLYIATHARDRYGLMLASGIVAMFAFHVIESAGMASGVMPVAGVPLPLISYGGSAVLADSMGIGILLNVWRYRHRVATVGQLSVSNRGVKRAVSGK